MDMMQRFLHDLYSPFLKGGYRGILTKYEPQRAQRSQRIHILIPMSFTYAIFYNIFHPHVGGVGRGTKAFS